MQVRRQTIGMGWAWVLAPALLLLIALPGRGPGREDGPLDRTGLRPGLSGLFRDANGEVAQAPSWPRFRLREGESLHPALLPLFQAEWTGLLRVPARGRYEIHSDARVFVDGQEVLGRRLRLPAGDLSLRILYERRNDVPTRLDLLWSSDAFQEQPIPEQALWHQPTALQQLAASVERGRATASRLRCFQCHETQADRSPRRRGPDLTHVGGRAHGAYLLRWLRQPREVMAHATMPALPLSEDDRRDIVAYLTGLSEFPEEQLGVPAPSILEQGQQWFQDLGCAACHDESLNLEHLAHKTTVGPLTEYLLDPRTVHPDGAMPTLFLHPDRDFGDERVKARTIAWSLLQSAPAQFPGFAPGDPARGEQLVYSSGCLACHTLAPSTRQRQRAVGSHATSERPAARIPEAPDLESMVLFGGCLSGDRQASSPTYRLDEREREDLVAFLRWIRNHPDRSPAPAHRFEHSVQELRCTACHEWRGQKPRRSLADPPPALTGAGTRRVPSFLQGLFSEARRRDQLGSGLRMPHYGPQHGPGLLQGLRATTPEQAVPETTSPR